MHPNPIFRSTPDARAIDVVRTRAFGQITAMGPDDYVSPDWYGVDDQVPTWNYVAVHIRGTLEKLDQDVMRDVLDRQTAHFEDELPKPPWTAEKMTPDVLEKMMRQIIPCRVKITDIQSPHKLSQNKPDDVRLRAADAMGLSGIGMETAALAALMRDPPKPD